MSENPPRVRATTFRIRERDVDLSTGQAVDRMRDHRVVDVSSRTELTAVDVATRYEQSQGRVVTYVGDGWPASELLDRCREWARSRHSAVGRLTCDLVSEDADGTIARLIEVKGLRARSTSVSIVDRQRNAMLGLGADWWLYVVLDCATEPVLVLVREPGRMCWELLTPPADLEPGRRYRRVDQEGRWHVMPRDVLEVGDVATF